jgi:hypothetical protein
MSETYIHSQDARTLVNIKYSRCFAFVIRTFVASKDNEYNNEILQALLNSAESNFITTDYIL